MKKLYKFHWDCGRQGDLEGVFIATEKKVSESIGKNAYFGEALGKHSEVYGFLEVGDFSVLSDDQTLIEKLLSISNFQGGTINGWNPLCYIDEEE